MNLLDHLVLDVLEPPQRGEAEGVVWWTVKCRVNCYGRESVQDVFARSEEEAQAIKPGTVYLA